MSPTSSVEPRLEEQSVDHLCIDDMSEGRRIEVPRSRTDRDRGEVNVGLDRREANRTQPGTGTPELSEKHKRFRGGCELTIFRQSSQESPYGIRFSRIQSLMPSRRVG